MNKNETYDSWLEKHMKEFVVHILVLGSFELYCIFLAGALSDRLEGIAGESRLHKISLPAATTNIQYNIGRFDVREHFIEINGWAFIKGKDCDDIEHYLVLKSDDNTYIFDTEPVINKERCDQVIQAPRAGPGLVRIHGVDSAKEDYEW